MNIYYYLQVNIILTNSICQIKKQKKGDSMSFLEFAYMMHDIANSHIFAAFVLIFVMFALLSIFIDD